jgi:methylthioxylose transferase
MKTARWILLGSATLAVVICAALLATGRMPLGVEGEWTWGPPRFAPRPLDLALAAVGVVAFSLFAAAGMWSLGGNASRRREAGWVVGLFLASVAAQVVVQSGGPDGHGLTKWATLDMRGSSGYITVAKTEMDDPWKFWAEYPRWIRNQDALHVGTHPPGLFLVSRGVLGVMESSPTIASWVIGLTPPTVVAGLAIILGPIPRPEKASIVFLGALTLLLGSATVIPLYLLARATLPASAAFAAAALWPIAPSPILFQPTADTVFPLLSTAALALAVRGGILRAGLAGVVLGVGMQFTLAFLPVGLVVAIGQLWRSDLSWRRRSERIAATGAGFLGLTGLVWAVSGGDPFIIWWWNQRNHARFYEENPRSYLAWVIANPIELAVALGLPTSIAAVAGFMDRTAPKAAIATLIVLGLLNISGKNLSEVARLWLIFMPALALAASHGLRRCGAKPGDLGILVFLLGCQTLAVQSAIQVVYPL